MGSGGFVNTVRASENTWGEVRGSRTHPKVQFPSDLLRNAKSGFRAETSRKSHALLVCYRLVAPRGKSVTRESDASFGELMGYAHLAFLIRIDWSCGTPPYLTVSIGWAGRLSRWWKCSEISVPHQDAEVPTKSYRRMNNLGTFWNQIRQNVERNQNQILAEKNVCTEFLTKLSDSEKSWMEI